ncbi:unnamed protein product [Closterium sp. NIES-53]
MAVCGPVRCASAQPLAPCLLAGDLTYTALDGEGWRCVGFWVWGSRAFVRDTSADKLSARAIPCFFLGFSPNASGWQFYNPTSRRVFPSEDVTFVESIPFYRVSHVDPLLGTAPVEVAVSSGAAPCVAYGGAVSGGAEPRCAESEGVGSGDAEPGGAETRGAELEGVRPGGAESEGAESGGAEPRGTASSGGRAGALPRLGAARAGDSAAGDTRVGGARVTAGAGGTGGAAAAGPGGARTRGTGAAGTGGVGGAGAGDPTEPRAAGTRGAGAGGAGAGGAGAGGAGAVDPGAGGAGGIVRPRTFFVPLLQQVHGVPSSTCLIPPLLCPPPDQLQPQLQPVSPLPAPSRNTEKTGGLTEHCEPASRPTSPIHTGRRVPRLRPTPVPGTHAMALRPSSVPLRVSPPPPPESSLPAIPNPESDRARAASPTVSRLLATVVTDPSSESTAASALVGELVDFAAACRLDYDTTLVAESESAGPPSVGVYCALGTDVLEDKHEDFKCLAATRQGVDYFQTFSPTPKMTTLWALLHVAAQRDYELDSLDFITAFLQGSLHEAILLRRPPGFTGSFLAGTKWSFRRPVYGLRQAPRKWQDTLRTTLAALGFTPSTADPSLFLRTDTSVPPFYVLVYVDDLVFATADTEALTFVKLEVQKRQICTDLGELRSYLGLQITWDRARRTITLTQSHMVHQVLQRFGFQFSSPQPTPWSTGHSLSAPSSCQNIIVFTFV